MESQVLFFCTPPPQCSLLPRWRFQSSRGPARPAPCCSPENRTPFHSTPMNFFNVPFFPSVPCRPGTFFRLVTQRNRHHPPSHAPRKKQERPYHDDSTASRLLSEVKHHRAWLVLRWGTTLESQVLFFFHRPAVVLPAPAAGSDPPRLLLFRAPRGNPSYARGGSHPPRLPPHRPSSSPQNAPPFNTKPMNFFDHPVFSLRLLPPGRVFTPHKQAKRPR